MGAPYRDEELVLRQRIAELEAEERGLSGEVIALRRRIDELKGRAFAVHPAVRGLRSLRGVVFVLLAIVAGGLLGAYVSTKTKLTQVCSEPR